MMVSEILSKSSLGDKIYVVREMQINWNNMRFSHTSIVHAEYIVSESSDVGLWGNNRDNILKHYYLPEGTKQYPSYLTLSTQEYHCFKSPEEAEMWKLLELQSLESKVEEHIETLKVKTQKKIKQLKAKENFEEYLEKYPEIALKVI